MAPAVDGHVAGMVSRVCYSEGGSGEGAYTLSARLGCIPWEELGRTVG